jgi:hypothetical protein
MAALMTALMIAISRIPRPLLQRLRWMLAAAISALAVALSLPPLRVHIEQSMLVHMAIQMPLLVLGGWCLMRVLAQHRLAQQLARWNRYGLTGFIAAQAILAYWMLPLAIDRAIVLPLADLQKLVSLLVCGALLQHSFARSPAVLQLFFVGYTVSMMTWLGFYFTSTDLRLCNAYSLESQVNTGRALVAWGLLLGAAWLFDAVRHAAWRTDPKRSAPPHNDAQ